MNNNNSKSSYPIHPQKSHQQQHRPSENSSRHLSDTIDAIIQAAEARQLSASAPESRALGEQQSSSQDYGTSGPHGPLTSTEISQLGYALVSPERKDVFMEGGSFSLDAGAAQKLSPADEEEAAELGESLTSLIPLLEQHVSIASQSKFVGKAFNLISGNAATLAESVDKVRKLLISNLKFFKVKLGH